MRSSIRVGLLFAVEERLEHRYRPPRWGGWFPSVSEITSGCLFRAEVAFVAQLQVLHVLNLRAASAGLERLDDLGDPRAAPACHVRHRVRSHSYSYPGRAAAWPVCWTSALRLATAEQKARSAAVISSMMETMSG